MAAAYCDMLSPMRTSGSEGRAVGFGTATCCLKYRIKSEFVGRFPELSLFYRLFSPLYSEMICIFPYFCPYAESAREIREIFS